MPILERALGALETVEEAEVKDRVPMKAELARGESMGESPGVRGVCRGRV